MPNPLSHPGVPRVRKILINEVNSSAIMVESLDGLFPIPEMEGLPETTGSDRHVEMVVIRQANLTELLHDVRTPREALTEQNHRDAKIRFNTR